MPSIASLVKLLQVDYPSFAFSICDEFRWSPKEKTIYYDPKGYAPLLLHEVAHGMLKHHSYHRDVQLLEIERAAWDWAVSQLASTYDVYISPDDIEDNLDTYREWLHARSTCPTCKATGIQIRLDLYKCVACSSRWRVNDARICALRRYQLN